MFRSPGKKVSKSRRLRNTALIDGVNVDDVTTSRKRTKGLQNECLEKDLIKVDN
jgi:hypothetical protein